MMQTQVKSQNFFLQYLKLMETQVKFQIFFLKLRVCYRFID